jgi:glutamate dehydrogenase/leucine dehydrogenase
MSAATLPAGELLERCDHERVEVVQDSRTGLRAVIAIHSTALGPAVGGLRMRPYAGLDGAVRDARRLSAAMSLKNAAAGLGLGGGKAVIVDDGTAGAQRDARLRAFADAIEALDGAYVTAEDVGTTPRDMDLIATRTAHVLGRSPELGGRGDPSPATARTVHAAVRAGVAARLGAADLAGLRVGIAGVGNVGAALARLLAADGAELTLADADAARAGALAAELGARVTETDALLRLPVDVLAPCATGEMIDAELAGDVSCSVIAGAANNPLVDDGTAAALHARGVLYAPDFLANCGGCSASPRSTGARGRTSWRNGSRPQRGGSRRCSRRQGRGIECRWRLRASTPCTRSRTPGGATRPKRSADVE